MIEVNDVKPELVVCDNFYNNPDDVRAMALEAPFEPSDYHKGQRSLSEFYFEGVQEKFEQLLGRKITEFTMAGRFQFCTAQDPLVIHSDCQTHAAVVFLMPDAPPQCGTNFYRRKGLNLRRLPSMEDAERFGTSVNDLIQQVYVDNYYDQTKFDLVDSIGNIYNRVVLWDAYLIHGAAMYFGTEKQNSRLFQMFFFNCDGIT